MDSTGHPKVVVLTRLATPPPLEPPPHGGASQRPPPPEDVGCAWDGHLAILREADGSDRLYRLRKGCPRPVPMTECGVRRRAG